MEADDDDIKQITTDLKLNTPQRLKLRKAIRSLRDRDNASQSSSRLLDNEATRRMSKYHKKIKVNGRSDSIIITEKEKDCMMQLSEYEKKLGQYMEIIKKKQVELGEEKKCKEDEIAKEFSVMFNILYERKANLIKELHFIYQQKLDKFEQSNVELKALLDETKKSQTKCSNLVLSQLGMDLQENIFQINEIEREISSITDGVLQPISPIDINTKINVSIKNKDVIQVKMHKKTTSFIEILLFTSHFFL